MQVLVFVGLVLLAAICGELIFFYDSFRNRTFALPSSIIRFEALSDTCELHVNAYIPLNRTKTDIYTLSYNFIPDS